MDSPDQGIVSMIGPEVGLTQPGMTMLYGDSHTERAGVWRACVGSWVGASEVEHVLATQCLAQQRPKTMRD